MQTVRVGLRHLAAVEKAGKWLSPKLGLSNLSCGGRGSPKRLDAGQEEFTLACCDFISSPGTQGSVRCDNEKRQPLRRSSPTERKKFDNEQTQTEDGVLSILG